jgi:thiosulfate/3-mercaptopyruvate sulfurtransferase
LAISWTTSRPGRLRKSQAVIREAHLHRTAEARDGVEPETRTSIGKRSVHAWLVLHGLLGYPSVENYDGSWTEYGLLVGVPVER